MTEIISDPIHSFTVNGTSINDTFHTAYDVINDDLVNVSKITFRDKDGQNTTYDIYSSNSLYKLDVIVHQDQTIPNPQGTVTISQGKYTIYGNLETPPSLYYPFITVPGFWFNTNTSCSVKVQVVSSTPAYCLLLKKDTHSLVETYISA